MLSKQLESAKNYAIIQHEMLARQLETKYQQHIDHLLSQKAVIREHLHSNLRRQLDEINKITSKLMNQPTNQPQRVDTTSTQFHSLSLPILTTNEQKDHKLKRPSSTPISTNITVMSLARADQPLSFPDFLLTQAEKQNNKDVSVELNGCGTAITEVTPCASTVSNPSQLSTPIPPQQQQPLSSFTIQPDIDMEEREPVIANSKTDDVSNICGDETYFDSNKHMAELFKVEGNRLLKQNRYKEAIKEYTKAIDIYPTNAVYFSNRALAQFKMKNYADTIIDAHKATEIDPYYIKAYIREGLAYYKLKQYKQSMDTFSKALRNIDTNINSEPFKVFANEINNNISLCQKKLNQQSTHIAYSTDFEDPPLPLISDGDDDPGNGAQFGEEVSSCSCDSDSDSDSDSNSDSDSEMDEPSLTCVFCLREFRTKEILQRHIKNHEIEDVDNEIDNEEDDSIISMPEPGEYLCKYCPYTTPHSNGMKYHLTVHERKVRHKYKCEECSYSAMSLSLFKKHEAVHAKELGIKYIFPCAKCDRTFEKQKELKMHLETHEAVVKQFVCPICGRRFAQLRFVKQHITTGHKLKRNVEKKKIKENKENKPTKQIAIKVGSKVEKPFQCETCGKRFKQTYGLIVHQRIHTGEKPYKCSECGEAFRQGNQLDKHIRIHFGDTPYKCSLCNLSFGKKSEFNAHKSRQCIIHQKQRKVTYSSIQRND